jgi:flagellar hook-basal body complex protein FliE
MVNPTNFNNIESVLNQIRQYQSEASSITNSDEVSTNSAGKINGFADSIKGAIEEVNATQGASKAIRNAYERGEDVPLTDVVMSIQKSSLAFEATLQIRNKVLKAYEEIMNMPV